MRFSSLLAVLLIPALSHAAELKWYTDFDEAKAAALAEKKLIMLDFTGSDWCGWCIKLKKEVFDTPEFAKYASEKLILMEVDFPHQKQLPKAQADANRNLAATYHISGYPTLVFVNEKGQPKGKGGYVEGGPRRFLTEIESAMFAYSLDTGVQPASATTGPPPAPAPPAAKPQPANSGIVAVAVNYTDLQLKGISGSKKHRMALINGQAFEVNDEAKIAVGKKELNVKCLEIGSESVKLVVDGSEKELKLSP